MEPSLPHSSDQFSQDLGAWGGYLQAGRHEALLISAVLPYLGDCVAIRAWRVRQAGAGVYVAVDRRVAVTAALDGDRDEIHRRLDGALLAARFAKLPTNDLRLTLPASGFETRALPEGYDDCILFVSFVGHGSLALEVHSKEAISEDRGRQLADLMAIFERLRSQAADALTVDPLRDALGGDDAEHLSDLILPTIKPWLDRDFKAVNLFLYDAFDRMLYHRATSNLQLDPAAVKQYAPSAMASSDKLLALVEENIARLPIPDSRRAALKALLRRLNDQAYIRKNAASQEANLKLLLTVLPQEPGTGVAGTTAISQVPSRSRPGVWNPDRWTGSRFSLMLSIEKLFGVGNSGSMVAVPLLECGQLAGVLFVVRQDEVADSAQIATLMQKAAQISPILHLTRTMAFQDAVLRSAARPGGDLLLAAAENAPAAFNSELAVLWTGSTVRVFGYPTSAGRFTLLQTTSSLTKPWSTVAASVNRNRLNWKTRGLLPLWSRPDSDSHDRDWPIPESEMRHFEEMANVRLTSCIALTLTDAGSDGVLFLFCDVPIELLKANLHFVRAKWRSVNRVAQFNSKAGVIRLPPPPIVGRSEKIQQLRRQIEAHSRIPRILLHGHRGCGKELVAAHIHAGSGRAGPLETVVLVEKGRGDADLIGWDKGSFNESSDHAGPYERSKNGSVFLDELHRAGQSGATTALLRLLNRPPVTFKRVGGVVDISVDVQTIAATNVSIDELGTLVGQDVVGRFITHLHVPSLEERRSDIPELVRHFHQTLSTNYHNDELRLTPKAWVRLLNGEWPDNVRALENMVERWLAEGLRVIDVNNVSELTLSFKPAADDIGEYQLIRLDPTWCDGQIGSEVSVVIGRQMYPPNSVPADDWVTVAGRAFQRLRALGKTPERFLTIGCGSGLDAIAAHHILRTKHIGLVDINAEVLALARENVLCNCPALSVDAVSVTEADLLSGAEVLGQFDLIYENLPNLPHEDVTPTGSDLATYQNRRRPHVPVELSQWLLDSHYDFLKQAKKFLRPEGVVLCAIGARVPWSVVAQMFQALGYEPELAAYEFKEQEEALQVIGGYARLEREEAPFRFYEYSSARQALEGRTSAALDVSTVDSLLGPPLTAREAATAFSKTTKIGHMVFLVIGRPLPATRPDTDLTAQERASAHDSRN